MKAFIVLALVVALVAISYGAPAGPGDVAQDAAKKGKNPEDAAKKAATKGAPDAPTGAPPGGDDSGKDDSAPTTTPKPHHHHHHHHKTTKKPGSGETKPPGGKPPGGKPPGGKPPGGKPPGGKPPGGKPPGGKPGDKDPYAYGPKNLNDNETNGIVDTVLKHNKDPKNRRGVFINTGEALAFNSRYRPQTPCENERGAVYQEGAQHKNFLEDLTNVLGETACTGTEAVETGKAALGKSKSDQGVNPVLEGIGLVVDTLVGGPKNLVGKPVEPNRPLLEGVDTLPLPK